MTPRPGEPLLPCLEVRVAEDAQRDFEAFLRFSASPASNKFKVEYTATEADSLRQKAFLAHIAHLAGVNPEDLDQLVVNDVTTSDYYARTLNIAGVHLLETAMVDDKGITQGVSYEAEYPLENSTEVPGPGHTTLSATVVTDPFVGV
jgi:hypothetical protein